MNETYNIQEAIKAQKNYQSENGFPAFPPKDGICWTCGKQIYEKKGYYVDKYRKVYDEKLATNYTGISVERAEKELVTGCPHCNRSYCD